MGGGSDKTTNVTKTGLGDEQFEQLQKNQGNISTQIGDTAEQSQQRLQEVSDQVGTRASQQSVDQGFAGVNQNVQQVGQQQQQGFADVGESLSGLSDQVGGVGQQVQQTGANLSDQLGGISTGVGGLNTAVSEGFGMTQDQLDRLSGQFAGFDETMTNQVNELGADVGNRLNDLSTTVQDQSQQASQERQTGFASLSDQLGSGFGEAATQLADAQSSIMGGQQQLNTMLEDTGNRLDTYYGGLAEGQQGIAQQVGGVQTGLNDFTQQYDQDTTLANQARADIQQGVANSADMIREDMGQIADASSANQERLIAAVGGNADAIQQGNQQTQQVSAAVQGGFQDQQNQQARIGQSINRVRSLLSQTADRLDPQTRQQYMDLVSSFDANGNLIPRGVDRSGRSVQRAVDNQNNLILRKFDPAGRAVGTEALNIPAMLEQAAQFEQSLTSGGLMAPYTQTR